VRRPPRSRGSARPARRRARGGRAAAARRPSGRRRSPSCRQARSQARRGWRGRLGCRDRLDALTDVERGAHDGGHGGRGGRCGRRAELRHDERERGDRQAPEDRSAIHQRHPPAASPAGGGAGTAPAKAAVDEAGAVVADPAAPAPRPARATPPARAAGRRRRAAAPRVLGEAAFQQRDEPRRRLGGERAHSGSPRRTAASASLGVSPGKARCPLSTRTAGTRTRRDRSAGRPPGPAPARAHVTGGSDHDAVPVGACASRSGCACRRRPRGALRPRVRAARDPEVEHLDRAVGRSLTFAGLRSR